MSLAEHTSSFAASPVWLGAIAAAENLDGDFMVWVRTQRLFAPFFWAGFLSRRDTNADRTKATELLTGAGALNLNDAERETRRIDIVVELCRVARELGNHWVSQVSRLPDPPLLARPSPYEEEG